MTRLVEGGIDTGLGIAQRGAYAVLDGDMPWKEKLAYMFDPEQMTVDFISGVVIGEVVDRAVSWLTNRFSTKSPEIESSTVPKTRLETGGRNLDGLSVDELLALDDEVARMYEIIRNSSDDVARISSQTGIPEWKIQKIKDHVFNNDHILRDRVGRFDLDIEIADAWEQLMNGNYNQNDLDLLNREYYEHRFEEFFGTDYETDHNRTVETGRVWDPYKEVD